MKKNKSVDNIIIDLKERAKELSCLYEVQELLSDITTVVDEICIGLVNAIPQGWQFPEICVVKIIFRDSEHKSNNFISTDWVLKNDIILQDEIVGNINVYYTKERPVLDEGPFLKEERKLLKTISSRMAL